MNTSHHSLTQCWIAVLPVVANQHYCSVQCGLSLIYIRTLYIIPTRETFLQGKSDVCHWDAEATRLRQPPQFLLLQQRLWHVQHQVLCPAPAQTVTAFTSTDQALCMYCWLDADPHIPLIREIVSLSFSLMRSKTGWTGVGLCWDSHITKMHFALYSHITHQRAAYQTEAELKCYFKLISKLPKASNFWLVCNKWSNSLLHHADCSKPTSAEVARYPLNPI